jgi:hypothetical protein
MNPIKFDTRAIAVGKWLRENLWKLGGAALLAIVGAVADRFSDEFSAWVRSVFVSGIGGTYTLRTFGHPDPRDTNFVPTSSTVELKDGGGTVFGLLKTNVSGAEYKLFGYHRVKFLLMSYGGKGPLGGGTLALQSDVASGKSPVFWGWRTYVECVGAPNPQSFLIECPAIMSLREASSPEEDYKDFLRPDFCRRATSHNLPELCDRLKSIAGK